MIYFGKRGGEAPLIRKGYLFRVENALAYKTIAPRYHSRVGVLSEGRGMDRWLGVVKTSPWVRAGLLLFAGLIVLWSFGLSPQQRQTIGLAAVYYLGAFAPALVLGAAWGWISYSRKQWREVTAVLVLGTLAIMMFL